MLVALVRIFKFAWQDFLRNWWLSFVTVTVILVTLFSVNLFIVWTVVTRTIITSIQEKVDVSLTMKPSVKEVTTVELQQYLQGFSEVEEVAYISRDAALERFRQLHADDTIILESLDELAANPFGATLVIRARSPEDYQKIVEKVTTSPYNELILDKSFGDHAAVIDRITNVTIAVRNVGLATSALFASIALLIVFNTIRMTIYTHREEIGIMKRVGATNWFTATPFLVDGVLYALVAFVVATALFFPFLRLLQPSFSLFFADYAFSLEEYFVRHGFFIFGAELVVVVVTCVLASAVATRRYLRV